VNRTLVSNIALAGWLAADVVRLHIFAGDLGANLTASWIHWAEMAVLAIACVFVLLRPQALRQDASPSAIAIAFSATLMPIIYGMAGVDNHLVPMVLAAQALDIVLMGSSLLCLRRNFSILPQYRSIVATGPYRLVRHPIYASYLLFDGALVVGAGSMVGVMLWLAEFWLLAGRAGCEENLLACSDPDYARYTTSVRWRLVPYVH
jgi:protein-S-isoprenylcysteine O-methyltransferase Ste14